MKNNKAAQQEQDSGHTDINPSGWIGRLPAAWQAYALLARLDRPVGIWLLLLPGWWGIALATGSPLAADRHELVLLALFGAGAVIMRGAGCLINDLWDRRLDAGVTRTRHRPLASGAVTVRQALIFLALLLAAGLTILLQMPPIVVALGVLSVPLILLYPLMKRVTWWPQLFLGLVFNFGALMGWAAVTGNLAPTAVLLYAGGIFWTLGYDTIYAHQDKEDDARLGIKSTARRLGAKSKIWVGAFYAAAWLLILAAFALAGHGLFSLSLLLIPALHLARQIQRWDMDDPQNCLDIFRSNRDFGLLVLLAAFF